MIYKHNPNETMTESTLSPQDIKMIYEYVERRNISDQDFRASVIDMYKRNARWSNPIIRFAVRMAALPLTPQNNSIQYFFWGTKFKEIILGLPKKHVCVIGGPKQLIFCFQHRIPFIPIMSLWKPLLFGLENPSFFDKRIASLIKQDSLQLTKKAAREAALIVDNDSLPVQRSMITASRLAKLRTICVQDGIFQSKSPGHIMHGWFSDLFLVYDEHQMSMLVNKGMNPKKIKIMGFHSSPYCPKRPTAPAGKRKVCFLGQPWNKYGHTQFNRYLEIVNKTDTILKKNGIKMDFKPHPWEKGAPHLKTLSNVVNISLSEALEKYDVFISLTSTALIEAQAAGRVAIQILDDTFDADDLSAHGKIYKIDVNSYGDYQDELLTALSASISHPSPDHFDSAATRFESALQS